MQSHFLHIVKCRLKLQVADIKPKSGEYKTHSPDKYTEFATAFGLIWVVEQQHRHTKIGKCNKNTQVDMLTQQAFYEIPAGSR